MAQFKQWFEQDFTEKIEIRHCESVMFTGDDQGTIVGVYLYDNGTPYSSGGTVMGYVKRSDGGVVVLTGAISGNAASIVLPAAALAYAGPIGVQITLAQGGQTTTVLKVIYAVDDISGIAVDPGELIPSLPELVAAAEAALTAIETKGEQVLASIPDDYETVSEEANWLGFGTTSADGITAVRNFDYGGDAWLSINDAIFLFNYRFINGIKSFRVRTKLANQDIKLLLLRKQGTDYVIVGEKIKNTGTLGYVDFGSVYVAGEYYAAVQGSYIFRTDVWVTEGYTCTSADIVGGKLTNLVPNSTIGVSADLVFFQSGEIDPDLFDGTDAEKLQKAFDLCEINGGTIVIRRKYTLADTVIIRHLYEKNNRIIVRGDAIDSEICVNTLFGFAGVNGSTGGVLFRDLKFCSIDPVNVTHSLLNGGMDSSSATLVNIIFENCYFHTLKFIYFAATKYVQSIWFIGCIIRTAGTMVGTAGNQWYNCLIRGCIVEGDTTVGSISWGEGVVICDNVIEGNPSQTAIDVSQGAYSVSIENNYFEANNRDITLSLTQPDRTVRIVGNFFANTAIAPITLPQAASATYGGAIVIENNKYLHSSAQGMAQYMIYGTSGETYDEVFCAFNSGDITALSSSELPVWKPTDFARRV